MIRCLVVDDSPIFREALRGILAQAPGVEVVGEAEDGDEAVAQVVVLRPDVITMDVRMPRRSGLEAIREIMERQPTPIVVVAAFDPGESQAISFQALKLGAVEVLEKPSAADPFAYERQVEAIRMAVRAVAGLKLITRRRRVEVRRRGEGRPAPVAPGLLDQLPPRPPDCVGIVASTGGPAALERILPALPGDFPVPVVVVQHIAEGFVPGLVHWLASQCAVQVRTAEAGERVAPGQVLFAPDRRHFMVSMGRVRLDDGPPVRGFKPSGTILLTSLAREYGPRAAGLVLTGMGDDGTAGLRLMRDQGAFTAAQGRLSSVVYGMPRVALETGAAQLSVDLDDIPDALLRLAGVRTGAPGARVRSRRKLLLIDDAETILQMERVLLDKDYELYVARNGREALELVERHAPDGLLLDMRLPLVEGPEVLKSLRAQAAHRDLPVIVVTAERDPEHLKAMWQSGCQAVLHKPLDSRELLDAVHRFVPP